MRRLQLFTIGSWLSLWWVGMAWAGGPFSQVPRSHWTYTEMTDLQRAGLSHHPDFQQPTTRTRYEFAAGLRQAARRMEQLARQAEDRRGQELLASERWVTLGEWAALRRSGERLAREFEGELHEFGLAAGQLDTLFVRLQGRLSVLEWRNGRLAVRGLIAPSDARLATFSLLGGGLGSTSLLDSAGPAEEGRAALPIRLASKDGPLGTLLLTPSTDATGRLGLGAGALLPLGSWGEAVVGYGPSQQPGADGVLGARLKMQLGGLDVRVDYQGLDLQGASLNDAPGLFTAEVQRRWEDLTLSAGYLRATTESGRQVVMALPRGWNSTDFHAISGGLVYARPRLSLAYRFEHYQSVTDLFLGRSLASLDYIADPGLSLQFRYERVQSDWLHSYPRDLASLSAGVEWQLSPEVQFRLLHRIPTSAAADTSLGISEGVTFSEVAIHF